MKIPLTGASLAILFVYFPDVDMAVVVQQWIGGVKPAALLAVPIVSAVQATFIYVRAKVRGELHLVDDKKVQAVLGEGDAKA